VNEIRLEKAQQEETSESRADYSVAKNQNDPDNEGIGIILVLIS